MSQELSVPAILESLSSIIPTDSAGCEPNALVECEHGCTLQQEGLDMGSVGEECETDEMSLPGGYIGGAQVDCSAGMTAETNLFPLGALVCVRNGEGALERVCVNLFTSPK